ncbi:ATP phosphoribosyltransferase regulatory subunit [Virgibacillus necropolis]|uniref:ATP phosphoribosyltransferase regulatory subunit n=1 Tax=Virgibacillus necropolis TaxID=163877 RepID=A0A221MHN8_9BACI|nr:ATP phosphoribosyltransferase regulatory subunit [Virgibacillus necropolis]ASN07177.1 ATP phosphoribosyltransferase regulatory subunit [Virgibacillus necropolis]
MMYQDIFDNTNDTSVVDFSKKSYLLKTIKRRFLTYGYRQIQTSTLEQYDLYQSITGTVHPDKMIKVIDPSGKILVLRPDVTIPITRMLASLNQVQSPEQPLFYISEVFRHSSDQQAKNEQTQAGIENFGPSTVELDAEVIALAIHTLRDLGFDSFKLEIGQASFFRELLELLNLTKAEKSELQLLIQAKNISEINRLLGDLTIQDELSTFIQQVPFLYGNFMEVINRAEEIALNEQMKDKLKKLKKLYEILQFYEVENDVSLDLGLINHMDYYSDIIFQGFVENVGKPVLMGGRYDQLADQLNATIPAIGFAFDVDFLVEAMDQHNLFPEVKTDIDIVLLYEKTRQRDAIKSASMLRYQGYRVYTEQLTAKECNPPASTSLVRYENDQQLLEHVNRSTSFTDQNDLLRLIRQREEDV